MVTDQKKMALHLAMAWHIGIKSLAFHINAPVAPERLIMVWVEHHPLSRVDGCELIGLNKTATRAYVCLST